MTSLTIACCSWASSHSRSPQGTAANHGAAPEVHLEKLTGPLFALGDYRDAITYAISAGRLGAVKVAFDLRGLRV